MDEQGIYNGSTMDSEQEITAFEFKLSGSLTIFEISVSNQRERTIYIYIYIRRAHNIHKNPRIFVDFGMILRVPMAPRGCFLDVVKSSECDLFNGSLVVRKSSLNFPGFI